MKRVFLIHGWDGNPNNHWFPWLKAELIARGFEVFAPAMPNPAEPKVAEWVSMLSEWVGKPDEKTFFVGHSLGCITIARYIESLPSRAVVGGVVFVAGFLSDLGEPEIAEFTNTALDAFKVHSRVKNIVSLISDNDSAVPFEKGLEFSQVLGARSIIEKGKGHFTKSDGVTSLPTVFSSILEMSSNPN